MNSLKLRPDLRNIKKIEKFQKLNYKGKTIRYNDKYFLFSGSLLRFENTAVVSGNLIFIQNTSNMIYSTEDLKRFSIIGTGQILGMIDHALIYKNDETFYIFNNEIIISLFFHFKDDKLLYSHTKIDKSPCIIKCHIIYNEFLAIASENNILFLSMNSVKDVQYRFPGAIKSMELIENEKILFLSVNYNRKGTLHTALFYQNNLLTRRATIAYEGSQKIIMVPKNVQNSSEVYLLDKTRDLDSDLIEHRSFDNFYSFKDSHKDILHNETSAVFIDIKEHNEDKNSYSFPINSNIFSTLSTDICISNRLHNMEKDKLQRNCCNDALIKFKISEVEFLAYYLASEDQKFAFLEAIFNGKSYSIVSDVKDKLIHMSKDISAFIFAFKSDFQWIISELVYNNTFSNGIFNFFYKPIKKYLHHKKCFNFSFGDQLTNEEIEFLERKYHRVFNYIPSTQNSENLAYKIIKFEEKNRIFWNPSETTNYISKFTHFNKTFLKLLRFYYGDRRMEEIVNIMLENQIIITADVDDLKSFRFDSFCARSYLNIGTLILNHKMTYYHSIHDLPIKSNNQNTDDSMPHEMIFLNSACISPFYKKPVSNSFYSQLGKAFGIGLINGLSDDEIQKFIKLIPGANDEHLKFILLVMSTRVLEEPQMKSLKINKILKSALTSADIELKKATICSLAIYNRHSNDLNIINTLKKELFLRGPVQDEKNSPFYNRNYRVLVSLAIGSIATRILDFETPDSFANLLIAGLSSIDSKVSSDLFYRTNDFRPDEVFYSQLFTLTSNFEMDPEQILDNFSLKNLETNTDVVILSAKLFYIGLYLIKKSRISNSEMIYNKLLNALEQIETELENDQKLRMLFNYALAACSIAKSGTCDLNLLKILRKEILITKEIKYMAKHTYFDCNKKELCADKKTDKESIQFYKICVGILTLNFGMSCITEKSIKQLIITFFYTGEISIDFNYIDILRCQLVRCLQPNKANINSLDKSAFTLCIMEKRKKLRKYFKSKFPKISEIDKKFVIDILSDYYENYNKKSSEETIFDIQMLANLISIAK